jgi:hypothetical protein
MKIVLHVFDDLFFRPRIESIDMMAPHARRRTVYATRFSMTTKFEIFRVVIPGMYL